MCSQSLDLDRIVQMAHILCLKPYREKERHNFAFVEIVQYYIDWELELWPQDGIGLRLEETHSHLEEQDWMSDFDIQYREEYCRESDKTVVQVVMVCHNHSRDELAGFQYLHMDLGHHILPVAVHGHLERLRQPDCNDHVRQARQQFPKLVQIVYSNCPFQHLPERRDSTLALMEHCPNLALLVGHLRSVCHSSLEHQIVRTLGAHMPAEHWE